MSSDATHCGVARRERAVHVPYGALPLSYAGTNAQFVWNAPSSFTQCPAVMTVLLLALVTALPEHEAWRPWYVKNTRPAVVTTLPPPVHAAPPDGKAIGDTSADGSTTCDKPLATSRVSFEASTAGSSRSSGIAFRIASGV